MCLFTLGSDWSSGLSDRGNWGTILLTKILRRAEFLQQYCKKLLHDEKVTV